MDRLPLEIKCLIAQWAGEDECQESIQALSKVNREWKEIATPVLHQHLVIRLRDGEIPYKLLQLSGPNAQSVLTRVKKMSLVAEWYSPNRPSDPLTGINSGYIRRTRDRFHCIPRVLGGVRLGELDSEAIPRVGSYTGDWSPIVDLIRQISSLRNINIVVLDGGPVKLFEALSQYHPTCQVSIFTTWPLMISRGPYGVIGENWALSPMLHAVHITCFENPRARLFIEHPDRLLQSIVLLAPQIREVSLQITSADLPTHGSNFNESIQVEEGMKNEKPPAKLQTLLWPLNSKMTVEQFREWQKVTDFRLLKAWTIGCVEDSILLQTIVDIQPFQRLTRLTLALVQPKGVDRLEFWRAAESMFNSLPRLTYLWILGSYTPTFLNSGVLDRHGSSLLELKLWRRPGPSQEMRRLSRKGPIAPKFSAEDTVELAGRCPALQKLLICVKRHKYLETDVWTALGRFPCLVELDLVLNCSPKTAANMMPVPPRDLSDFEKGLVRGGLGYRRWFIRESMINCAISESLAKAYFMHILACQDAKYLARLVIRPVFSRIIRHNFFDKLALTWTVKWGYLTGLHATSEQTSTSSSPATETELDDEMLSIFQSI